MRHSRWPRPQGFTDTNRKRAGVLRSQKRQRDQLPLFAPLIAETQPNVDDEMTRRAVAWGEWQQDLRDRRAAHWRRARARLAGYGDNLRPALRAMWREAPYPAEPEYLLDMLHGVDVARIDPAQPPWRPSPEEIAFLKGILPRARAKERERRESGQAAPRIRCETVQPLLQTMETSDAQA